MNILNKRVSENIPTDNENSKKAKTDFKIHNFKKKKLKHMNFDSKKNKFLSVLENLLSHKKEWQDNDVESLFSIMYDHFEVVTVYGYQIENAILDFIDVASSDKAIQVAALCLSRFASIKKSNGTVLLQNILSTFLKLGKDYFDYFNIPSNLNEIKYTFKESFLSFSELIISDDTIFQLVKRIKFLVYVTNFVFETNYDLNFLVPFENLTKTIIGFLSTTPQELIDSSKKMGMSVEIPFYVNIHIWKLFKQLLMIPEFKAAFFDIIPKICEIIRLCLSEDLNDSPLHRIYLSNILEFLSYLLSNEARYCLPTVSCLTQIIIENVASITTKASSNSYENVIILYLQVINKLLSFYHDKSIQKCVNTFSYQLKRIKDCLIYLESKSIFSTWDFLIEFKLFVRSTSKFVLNDSMIECPLTYFENEEKINFENQILSNDNSVNKDRSGSLEIGSPTESVDIIEETIENSVENIQKTICSSSETEANSQDNRVDTDVGESIKSDTIHNKSEEFIPEKQENETQEQKLKFDGSEQLEFEDKVINLEEMLKSFVPC